MSRVNAAALVAAVVLKTTVAAAQPAAPCEPPCRSGFVCGNGVCVSACNPPCAADEVCVEGPQCVLKSDGSPPVAAPTPPPEAPPPVVEAPPPAASPAPAPAAVTPAPVAAPPAPVGPYQSPPPATSSEDYPYSRFRIGLGGGVGIGVAPDGTGYPFAFALTAGFPLSTAWYGHGELMYSHFTTSTDASYDAGSTYLDSEHTLVIARMMAGRQISPLVGVRAGLLVGNRNLYAEQGICGYEYKEKEWDSLALGAAGALAFNVSHAEFSLNADAYSAKTQATCTGYSDYQLTPTDKLGLQLIALGTFLL